MAVESRVAGTEWSPSDLLARMWAEKENGSPAKDSGSAIN